MHNRGSYVDGIGDEVIYGVTASLFCLVPIAVIMFVWNRRTQNGAIHPDSQENVDSARQRLREQNRAPLDNATQTDHPRPEPTAPPRPADSCPICLGQVQYAIETNCGHIFCGQCLITYWRMGPWVSCIRCPMCRQQVTIMLFNFAEHERAPSQERDSIMEDVNSYNRRFSGEPRSWMEHLQDLPTLIRHAFNEFFSLNGLILMFRFRVLICFLAALLYFISPLDIIPEAMFGILGFLDDFFVFLLLAIYVSIIYRQMVAARAQT